MTNETRRKFLIGAGAVMGATALPVVAESMDGGAMAKRAAPGLLHNVYFWLKNPESESDRDRLIAGLKTLAEVPSVRGIHIGMLAPTMQRDVVERSFQVSELLMFDDVEGQDAYQTHPIHQQFVADCEHLWRRVVVYDSQLV